VLPSTTNIGKTITNYVGFQVLTAASTKFTVFWDALPCSQITVIALMMQAARTYETPVYIDLRTWQDIPEGSELITN
jgi:hypothetical protein